MDGATDATTEALSSGAGAVADASAGVDVEPLLGMASSGLSSKSAFSPAAVILACTTKGGSPTFSILKKGS